jgi:hypothetical protein
MKSETMTIQTRRIADLKRYAGNAREHPEAQLQKLAESIKTFGFCVPVLLDRDGVLIAGHGRILAAERAGLTEVPTLSLDHLTADQARALRIADNKIASLATWDADLLRQELAGLKDAGIDLGLTGFAEDELSDLFAVATDPKAMSLSDKFLVPPFSILDARQGYWQSRKREWMELGIESEVGRGDNLLEFSEVCNSGGYRGRAKSFATEGNLSGQTGTSIFDPTLCEVAYRWFAPPGGTIIDPFAGGSVRGIVASRLGRHYVGVELRPEQIAANRQQAGKIVRATDPAPTWIEGDAQRIKDLVPAGTRADFAFACPPFADLEVYSDDPRDLSNMPFEQFADSYRAIIRDTCDLLADNRFACWVIGDVRDPKGNYRDLIGLTVDAFRDAGLQLYNMAILVTAIGSLPLRVGTQFAKSRKLGKTHQEVVVAFKGDMDAFKQSFALKTVHHNVAIF